MVRLFPAQVDDRRQPVLLKGEVERGMLQKADLSFDGAVGGVEGHLSDEYTGGYTILTNFRVIWVAAHPSGMPLEGVPCHFPLGSVARSECSPGFLSFKAARIKLDVRLDQRGYPSSDALRVAGVKRVKIVVKGSGSGSGSGAEAWHQQLVAAVERRAWAAAAPGLRAELHTPPPPGLVTRPSSGPMTPPPHLLQQMAAPALPQTSPQPDEGMLAQLVAMGFPRLRAANALLATGNAGAQQAADWLLDNAGSPLLLDRPLAFAAPGAGLEAGSCLQPPPQQGRTGPRESDLRQMSMGGAGVAGILRREEKRAAATDRSLDEAFTDLSQLMGMAGEMVALAESLRERMKRRCSLASSAADIVGGGGGSDAGSEAEEEERMDDALAQALADLGIASPVTRESAGKLFYQELSRQLAAFLQGPVERAGGMMPLPEAYRLFNRARFTDLVSPEDMLQAAKLFPAVRAPLSLREFASGVKVVQSAAVQEEAMCRRVVELAVRGAAARHPSSIYAVDTAALEAAAGAEAEAGAALWCAALGPGVTRAEAAAALGMPLPVAAEHLVAAEARGLLCRDDGPEGLRFYRNFFAEVHAT